MKDIRTLERIINDLRTLRDEQTTVPCPEVGCLCDTFDKALDQLDDIHIAFYNAVNEEDAH